MVDGNSEQGDADGEYESSAEEEENERESTIGQGYRGEYIEMEGPEGDYYDGDEHSDFIRVMNICTEQTINAEGIEEITIIEREEQGTELSSQKEYVSASMVFPLKEQEEKDTKVKLWKFKLLLSGKR